jgi:hypothetical protein
LSGSPELSYIINGLANYRNFRNKMACYAYVAGHFNVLNKLRWHELCIYKIQTFSWQGGFVMQHYYRAGLLAIAALLVMVGFAPNSQAQTYYGDGYAYQQNGVDAATYNGYQLGYGAGANDRASGRGYSLNDHKEFRDADSGFSGSGYSSKGAYEQTFRSAYLAGYRDGISGHPRQVYYGGDYNNNGGTYYNRGVRERDRYYYRNRHRNRDRYYWPF